MANNARFDGLGDFYGEENLYGDVVNELGFNNPDEVLDYLKAIDCTPAIPLTPEDLEFRVKVLVSGDNPAQQIATLIQRNHMLDITVHNLDKLTDACQDEMDVLRATVDALKDINNDLLEEANSLDDKLAESLVDYDNLVDLMDTIIDTGVQCFREDAANKTEQVLLLEETLQSYEGSGFWKRLRFLLTGKIN